VIQNATVHTITKGTFTGSVLVRDGRIADVAPQLLVPAGASVVDGTGKHLIPGMIDSHVHYAADATNEGSISVSSMVRIDDVINAEQVSIPRALAGGVTTALIVHGSANPIGGLGSVVKMRPGQDAEGLKFKEAAPTIKMALGENPKRQGEGGQSPFGGQQARRYPGTRMGVEDVIRTALTEARNYQAQWKAYQEARQRGADPLPPRRDLKLEPLVELLEGKRLAHVHCYRADEILMILRLSEEFGFKIPVLVHALEGYKVAKEVAAHGAGVSALSDWWSYKIEAYDAIPYNAALLAKNGVLVSLHSDDIQAELTRRLNVEAAKAVKYGGVADNDALAMITINPAKQLKIDQYVGSIESGKQADLALFDKHPLSTFAKVEKVWVDGRLYFDRDTEMTGRPERITRKQTLIQRERELEKRSGPAVPAAKRPGGGAE
jgi:imidazolonepropionase-like amidohydrolase